ncbi:MAG: hypothetical protein E7001_03020 [Coriobacteriaceae bacterium]|nr:hypothetical protein [Coriobacteriaceae bacterium]
MAADNRFTVPACAAKWLRGQGHAPYQEMGADIERWWGWYTGAAEWYGRTAVAYEGGAARKTRYRCYSIRPARRVCREWASLMFDDGTRFAAEDPGANAWLQRWAASTGLLAIAQRCTERAFALGTGALALAFSVPEDASAPATMRLRRYDARMILPLSWSDEGTTECAFVTEAAVRGQRVTQVQAHVVEGGTYRIRSAYFDARGRQVTPEGLLADFDTGQALPTFCLIRPAVDNLVADMSPLGQSVFEDAVDAIKAVDDAFDTLVRELAVTKPKVFMADQLLQTFDGPGGRRVAVPMVPEETVIRAVSGYSGGDLIKTFQPSIRSGEIRDALDTALAELGDLTGFGQQYFTLSKRGGPKTATEVSADSSALMRNLRKHEVGVGASLSAMLTAALSCARSKMGVPMGDPGAVSVTWDDSIIEDTPAEKSQMLAEVSSGVVSPWEYRRRFLGEDERTARSMADEARPGAAPVV